MLIRNRKAIDRVLRKYAQSRKPLKQWLEIVQSAEWNNIIEARATWPTADAIKGTPLTCFNVGGNSFRLIAAISYLRQEIIIEEIITHAEYTRKYTRQQ